MRLILTKGEITAECKKTGGTCYCPHSVLIVSFSFLRKDCLDGTKPLEFISVTVYSQRPYCLPVSITGELAGKLYFLFLNLQCANAGRFCFKCQRSVVDIKVLTLSMTY